MPLSTAAVPAPCPAGCKIVGTGEDVVAWPSDAPLRKSLALASAIGSASELPPPHACRTRMSVEPSKSRVGCMSLYPLARAGRPWLLLFSAKLVFFSAHMNLNVT